MDWWEYMSSFSCMLYQQPESYFQGKMSRDWWPWDISQWDIAVHHIEKNGFQSLQRVYFRISHLSARTGDNKSEPSWRMCQMPRLNSEGTEQVGRATPCATQAFKCSSLCNVKAGDWEGLRPNTALLWQVIRSGLEFTNLAAVTFLHFPEGSLYSFNTIPLSSVWL